MQATRLRQFLGAFMTEESDNEVRILTRAKVASVPSQPAKVGRVVAEAAVLVTHFEVLDDSDSEANTKAQEPRGAENKRW